MTDDILGKKRAQILQLVEEYHRVLREQTRKETVVRVSGKVFDSEEMKNLVDSALDFWLTAGRFTKQFERRFAQFNSVRWSVVVNSGSSANLAAILALTSPRLGERRLQPGDEVLTVAAAFPTTVNPILFVGAVPVFVDITLPTYNVDVNALEKGITEKTKAIILAHTLGNPFDLNPVIKMVRQHRLWLIEDACDALGSLYEGRQTGTFGDLATFSFYPAHHITMGEGGAVLSQNPTFQKIVTSIRDWGRDCWCETGFDNTCGIRFDRHYKLLPPGYDHKYVYSNRGLNLKATDMQASIGLAQMDKLPGFIEKRKQNFHRLYQYLLPLQDRLILPEATPGSEPAWFGFPITLRDTPGAGRSSLMRYLNDRGIHTRLLFGGNLVKQPYMEFESYRVSGSLANTDEVMERTFWVGVYPALGDWEMRKIARTIENFFRNQGGTK